MVSCLRLFRARARSGREVRDGQALSGERFGRRGETPWVAEAAVRRALLVALVARCFQLVIARGSAEDV